MNNDKNIYVTMPTLAPLEEVTELLQFVWASGIMTHNGPLVQRFEKEVCDFLGVKHMVSVVNGTIALHVAIKALELRGEIITTPFTFIATSSSILWEKCTPVFVDIDVDTLNMDPRKIEERITDKTVAILPVHVFGNPCDVHAIDNIAQKHHLKVIYDAAHAVGVKYDGKSIFEFGDISTTSFHATKMLNTAEGGACFTQDDKLFERMQQIRFFGFDRSKDIVCEGTNAKMTEVNAAIGIANLRYLQLALDDRKKKYFLYKELLDNSNNRVSFQKINQDCNYSYFPVIFDTEDALLKAEKALNASKFIPRRYFYPSLSKFKILTNNISDLTNSEFVSKRILCLPLYYNLLEYQVESICDIINKSLR